MSKIDAESYYDYDEFDSESSSSDEETENESRIKSFSGFILMTESQRNPVGPGEPGAIHIELDENESYEFEYTILGEENDEYQDPDLIAKFKAGLLDITEEGWVWFYADDEEVKSMLNKYYPEKMKDLL